MAVPVSEKLRRKILNWQKKNKDLPVRWVKGKNLHLTLVPPWHEEDLESVKKSLMRASKKFDAFDLEFSKIEYGPSLKSPRLIWATGKTSKKIEKLKSTIEKVLKKEPEKRSFCPHITLARFNPQKFKPHEKVEKQIDWEETVESFVLMESHLSKRGADYEFLDTFGFSADNV